MQSRRNIRPISLPFVILESDLHYHPHFQSAVQKAKPFPFAIWPLEKAAIQPFAPITPQTPTTSPTAQPGVWKSAKTLYDLYHNTSAPNTSNIDLANVQQSIDPQINSHKKAVASANNQDFNPYSLRDIQDPNIQKIFHHDTIVAMHHRVANDNSLYRDGKIDMLTGIGPMNVIPQTNNGTVPWTPAAHAAAQKLGLPANHGLDIHAPAKRLYTEMQGMARYAKSNALAAHFPWDNDVTPLSDLPGGGSEMGTTRFFHGSPRHWDGPYDPSVGQFGPLEAGPYGLYMARMRKADPIGGLNYFGGIYYTKEHSAVPYDYRAGRYVIGDDPALSGAQQQAAWTKRSDDISSIADLGGATPGKRNYDFDQPPSGNVGSITAAFALRPNAFTSQQKTALENWVKDMAGRYDVPDSEIKKLDLFNNRVHEKSKRNISETYGFFDFRKDMETLSRLFYKPDHWQNESTVWNDEIKHYRTEGFKKPGQGADQVAESFFQPEGFAPVDSNKSEVRLPGSETLDGEIKPKEYKYDVNKPETLKQYQKDTITKQLASHLATMGMTAMHFDGARLRPGIVNDDVVDPLKDADYPESFKGLLKEIADPYVKNHTFKEIYSSIGQNLPQNVKTAQVIIGKDPNNNNNTITKPIADLTIPELKRAKDIAEEAKTESEKSINVLSDQIKSFNIAPNTPIHNIVQQSLINSIMTAARNINLESIFKAPKEDQISKFNAIQNMLQNDPKLLPAKPPLEPNRVANPPYEKTNAPLSEQDFGTLAAAWWLLNNRLFDWNEYTKSPESNGHLLNWGDQFTNQLWSGNGIGDGIFNKFIADKTGYMLQLLANNIQNLSKNQNLSSNDQNLIQKLIENSENAATNIVNNEKNGKPITGLIDNIINSVGNAVKTYYRNPERSNEYQKAIQKLSFKRGQNMGQIPATATPDDFSEEQFVWLPTAHKKLRRERPGWLANPDDSTATHVAKLQNIPAFDPSPGNLQNLEEFYDQFWDGINDLPVNEPHGENTVGQHTIEGLRQMTTITPHLDPGRKKVLQLAQYLHDVGKINGSTDSAHPHESPAVASLYLDAQQRHNIISASDRPYIDNLIKYHDLFGEILRSLGRKKKNLKNAEQKIRNDFSSRNPPYVVQKLRDALSKVAPDKIHQALEDLSYMWRADIESIPNWKTNAKKQNGFWRDYRAVDRHMHDTQGQAEWLLDVLKSIYDVPGNTSKSLLDFYEKFMKKANILEQRDTQIRFHYRKNNLRRLQKAVAR